LVTCFGSSILKAIALVTYVFEVLYWRLLLWWHMFWKFYIEGYCFGDICFEVLYWKLLLCSDILGKSNYAAYTVAEFKLGRDDWRVKLLRVTVRKPVGCVCFIQVIMIRGQWQIFTNDKNSIVEFVWQTLVITSALNLEAYTKKKSGKFEVLESVWIQ